MRPRILLIITLWTLAVASVAGYAWLRNARAGGQPAVQFVIEEGPQPGGEEELPVLFAAPRFSLTDHHGKAFSSDALKGKVWIAFIFLTNCPTGACPVMVGKMAKLQEALPDEQVHFVSFSIDPQRDTPEVLRRYAEEVGGADVSDRWHLLTGDSPEQMRSLALEMKLAVGDDWGHSTAFLLIDGRGNVRGSYGNEDAQGMSKLAAAAARLLEEPRRPE